MEPDRQHVRQQLVYSGCTVCVSPCGRELLQKDEAMLRQLLQQQIKKKEALKAAEVKVTKLREQLLASERIVGANKTLLRKLQEQVNVQPFLPVMLFQGERLVSVCVCV